MNLGQMRAEVLACGFDANQYSGRINMYLNDALSRAVRRVQYYTDEATLDFNTVSGTYLYPQPADFAKDRSLRDTVRGIEMAYATLREIDRSVITSGSPTWYAIDGSNLHLYPTPDNVYPMELRYWKTVAPLVNDTDIPSLPDTYHRMLTEYAIARCYWADDDPQIGGQWDQKFQVSFAEFAADVKFPDDDAASRIQSFWDSGKGLSRGWSIYGSSWEP